MAYVTSTINMQCTQIQQKKVIRGTVNAAWFVRNEDVYRDLKTETVMSGIKRFAQNCSTKITTAYQYGDAAIAKSNNPKMKLED